MAVATFFHNNNYSIRSTIWSYGMLNW